MSRGCLDLDALAKEALEVAVEIAEEVANRGNVIAAYRFPGPGDNCVLNCRHQRQAIGSRLAGSGAHLLFDHRRNAHGLVTLAADEHQEPQVVFVSEHVDVLVRISGPALSASGDSAEHELFDALFLTVHVLLLSPWVAEVVEARQLVDEVHKR